MILINSHGLVMLVMNVMAHFPIKCVPFGNTVSGLCGDALPELQCVRVYTLDDVTYVDL